MKIKDLIKKEDSLLEELDKDTKKSITSVYSVGDRVQINPDLEHDEMTKGQIGTIVEISTPALGIKFDGMEKVHKWYVDTEVKKVTNKKQKPMKSMEKEKNR